MAQQPHLEHTHSPTGQRLVCRWEIQSGWNGEYCLPDVQSGCRGDQDMLVITKNIWLGSHASSGGVCCGRQKLRSSLEGAQGYQRFPSFCNPGVGQNIALHAAPADRTWSSTLLVSAFPIHSTLFSPNFDAEIKCPCGGSPGISKFPFFFLACSRSEYSFTCCACLQDFYLPNFYLPQLIQLHFL